MCNFSWVSNVKIVPYPWCSVNWCRDCYNTESLLSKMTYDAYKINLVYEVERMSIMKPNM